MCCKCERRKTGRTAALKDRVWTALRLPGSRRNNGKSGTGMSCREGSQWTQRQLRPSPGLRRPDPARLTRVGPPTQPIQVIGSSASCARSPMKISTAGQHLKRAGWELKDRQRHRFFQAVQSLTGEIQSFPTNKTASTSSSISIQLGRRDRLRFSQKIHNTHEFSSASTPH